MHFRQVLSKLVAIYEIGPDDLTAFYHRMKNYQKLGWPVGSNTGQGRAATYSTRMLREMVFATELNVLGIPPERAIQIIKANLPQLHRAAENGDCIEIPCPPLFGDRIPDGLIKLDMRRAMSIALATEASRPARIAA